MAQFQAELERARVLHENAQRLRIETGAAYDRVKALCQSIRAEVARMEAGDIPGALAPYKPARRRFRGAIAADTPLSSALFASEMRHPCPTCGAAIVKPGSWFKTVWQYRCPACNGAMRFTYDDKLAIFAKHAPN